MLKYEWMGIFVLGVLWINTLLIAADIFLHSARLWAFLGALKNLQVFRVRLLTGRGPDGVFAQVKRSLLGRFFSEDTKVHLTWVERAEQQSTILGGTAVVVSGRDSNTRFEVTAADRRTFETTSAVWMSSEKSREAAVLQQLTQRLGDPREALKKAKALNGWTQEVTVSIGASEAQTAWYLLGRRQGGARFAAEIMSDQNPYALVWGRIVTMTGVALGVCAMSAGITYFGLSEPVFEGRSLWAGVTGLIYFLLVQPLGVWARGFAVLPGEGIARVETALPVSVTPSH